MSAGSATRAASGFARPNAGQIGFQPASRTVGVSLNKSLKNDSLQQAFYQTGHLNFQPTYSFPEPAHKQTRSGVPAGLAGAAGLADQNLADPATYPIDNKNNIVVNASTASKAGASGAGGAVGSTATVPRASNYGNVDSFNVSKYEDQQAKLDPIKLAAQGELIISSAL